MALAKCWQRVSLTIAEQGREKGGPQTAPWHPVISSGSIICDRDDQGSHRVVHDESEMARLILICGLYRITETSGDQHGLSDVRHSRDRGFDKQLRVVEF